MPILRILIASATIGMTLSGHAQTSRLYASQPLTSETRIHFIESGVIVGGFDTDFGPDEWAFACWNDIVTVPLNTQTGLGAWYDLDGNQVFGGTVQAIGQVADGTSDGQFNYTVASGSLWRCDRFWTSATPLFPAAGSAVTYDPADDTFWIVETPSIVQKTRAGQDINRYSLNTAAKGIAYDPKDGTLWTTFSGAQPGLFRQYDKRGQLLQSYTKSGIEQGAEFNLALAPPTDRLAPVSQTVNLGKVTAGNLASLAAEDGNAQTICKFFVPNQSSPFVRTVLNFVTTRPQFVDIHLGLRMRLSPGTGGVFVVRGFLRDVVSTANVQVLNDKALTANYQTYMGFAPLPLPRFVGGGGAIQATVEVQQVGPSSVLLPCVDIDRAVMYVTG